MVSTILTTVALLSSTATHPKVHVPARPSAAISSVVTLQQTLADLGYLPVTHNLKWKYSKVPTPLKQLWKPGVYSVMTRGAVMQFQADHGLATDGIAGPLTWSALHRAMKHDGHRRAQYAFVYVSETSPFTLSLWDNGRQVLRSKVNLGIDASPTVTGAFPVYLQYRTQDMRGTMPDGQHYNDPGVPYVSYFYGGEAVHGFVRASYGSKQSLGCIELPVPVAKKAWQYIHIGTIVDIGK